jgi:hypothetical protein
MDLMVLARLTGKELPAPGWIKQPQARAEIIGAEP